MNRNNPPIVTVIIRAYNQADVIGRAIESVLAQKTDFNFEILLGEDASPDDNTREICERYEAENPTLIRLMPKSPNKGLVRNTFECIKTCRNEFIAVCDGDDYWCNDNKLQIQVDFLKNNTDYGLVYTDFNVDNKDKGSIVYSRNKSKKITHPSGSIYEVLLRGNTIAAGTAMFRNSLFAQYVDVDAYIAQGFIVDDYPIWLAISRVCKVQYLDISTLFYTLAKGSSSNSGHDIERTKQYQHNVLSIRQYFNTLYPAKGVDYRVLQALYCADMLTTCALYNLHTEAKHYAWALCKLQPSIKNLVKLVGCLIPFLFKQYHKRLIND